MGSLRYFDTLPTVVYTKNGNSILYTNLLARASVRPAILQNSSIYYEYDIQESDTPEIIAAKYYDDPFRFWMVLLPNNILDAQWGWPLESIVFKNYIESKYPNVNTQNLLNHYEKVITQTELTTNRKVTFSVRVDQETWDSTVESKSIVTTATGQVEIVTTKRSVSVYDYEYNLNEKKRKIKLINAAYADQLEKELLELMA
jgi:hypothetical protein